AVTLQRLADQFQRDVRAADKILRIEAGHEVTNENPPERTPGRPATPIIVRLRLGETVVGYAQSAAGVTRDVLRSGTQEQRELFRLPPQARATNLERVQLMLPHPKDGNSHLTLTIDKSSATALRVQAALGADLRFAAKRAKEEP